MVFSNQIHLHQVEFQHAVLREIKTRRMYSEPFTLITKTTKRQNLRPTLSPCLSAQELRVQIAEQRKRGDQQEAALGEARDAAAKQAATGTATVALLTEQVRGAGFRACAELANCSGYGCETSAR